MKPAEATIHVMLIDDHQTMLWGLGKLIDGEKPRMEVIGTALTCEEALGKIEKLVPDVILLDLDLNGKNGLDILPALISNAVSRVLILTGERKQATLDMAILRGARGIVHKDASAEHVLKAIEKTHQGELWLDREALGRVFGELMSPVAVRKPESEADKKAALTAKEQKIVHTIIEGSGASNKALAQRLFISEHTLCNHLTSIYHKLDVNNRLELYVYAIKHQLGNPTP